MKKSIVVSAIIILAVSLSCAPVFAHCEIPCGIYDDTMRIQMMEEHITTIEKAMRSIQELSAEPNANYNQIVRWVAAKDEHAEALQEVVFQYFLTQRIKPVDDPSAPAYQTYVKSLACLHTIAVYAMKAKQTIDHHYVEALRESITVFHTLYFGLADAETATPAS